MLSQWTGRGFGFANPGTGSSERHRGRAGDCQGKRANEHKNFRHCHFPHCGEELAGEISFGAVPKVTSDAQTVRLPLASLFVGFCNSSGSLAVLFNSEIRS